MATTFTWTGTAAAWANAAGTLWGRATDPHYPGDTGSDVGDTIVLAGADGPTDGPAGALTVANFTTTALAEGLAATISTNLTVTGQITMGNATDPQYFGGTVGAACSVDFSLNAGIVTANGTGAAGTALTISTTGTIKLRTSARLQAGNGDATYAGGALSVTCGIMDVVLTGGGLIGGTGGIASGATGGAGGAVTLIMTTCLALSTDQVIPGTGGAGVSGYAGGAGGAVSVTGATIASVLLKSGTGGVGFSQVAGNANGSNGGAGGALTVSGCTLTGTSHIEPGTGGAGGAGFGSGNGGNGGIGGAMGFSGVNALHGSSHWVQGIGGAAGAQGATGAPGTAGASGAQTFTGTITLRTSGSLPLAAMTVSGTTPKAYIDAPVTISSITGFTATALTVIPRTRGVTITFPTGSSINLASAYDFGGLRLGL